MALDPLGDAVLIEIIEHEPDMDLVDSFLDATESSAEDLDLSRERRRIEASISQKVPQTQQGTVFAAGPDCRELEPGDKVIFPLYSGSMVTVVDEALNTYKRVFVVSETNCLARYREG